MVTPPRQALGTSNPDREAAEARLSPLDWTAGTSFFVLPAFASFASLASFA